MVSWILRWNFDKTTYSPGETAIISFWVENTGDTYLYFDDFEISFDFGTYKTRTISGQIPPRSNRFLGLARILLPKRVVGRKLFTIKHRVYEYFDNKWVNRGTIKYEKKFFLSIYPRPFYRVFVSRGLRIEDRAIGDPIVEMIKEWGFKTVTVGVEKQVPEEQVPMAVKTEIQRCDAIIAIATPRHLDALTGLWRTLEWLYSETGIAYGLNKPMLILKDKRVSLGGLPSYLVEYKYIPVIEFDPYNLDELRTKLAAIMPSFREWIETKRRQEFFEALGRIVVGGLTLIGLIALPGIIGSILGSFKK
ncbi:MAG: hypothetical protein ACTSXX_12450 [Candidatus Baldrarchaeia archaeon]